MPVLFYHGDVNNRFESPDTETAADGGVSQRSDSPARRMGRWTMNLLASGLMVVMCIGLGRHVLDWSRRSEPPPLGAPQRMAAFRPPSLMEFGDGSGSFQRTAVEGELETAVDWLRDQCRAAAQGDKQPRYPPTAAEKRLLEHTARREPVEQREGEWSLFRFDGGFPFIVAVSHSPPATGRPSRRMVAWGMVVPAGEQRWSAYIFRAVDRAGESATTPQFPLPGGCQRTLTMRSDDGSVMVGFNGAGPAKTWREFFDARLNQRGYRRGGSWLDVGGVWLARYHLEKLGGPQTPLVEIQFTRRNSRYQGIITFASNSVPVAQE